MLINEYFNEVESQISKRIHILESRITRDKRSAHIGIIEGELVFKDESVLHFIEFVNVKDALEVYKYSYHYRTDLGDLIFRYDMAPHHREIDTFPHHKHLSQDKVIRTPIPNLQMVLDKIDDLIA